MMPFERYLQDPDFSSYGNTQDVLDMSSTAFSNKVQLQIPHFMYTGPPTLAPGGGAEVLSVGTFTHNDALAASWFTNNNGFSPDEAYLSSSLRSGTSPGSYGNAPPEHHSTHPNIDIHHYDLTGATLISQASPLQPPPQTMNHDENIHSQTRDQPSLTEHSLTFGEPIGLPAPSPLGFPVYSATGFDVLSILARVATRPNPRVVLGPVDLTCSFAIVDIRRHDHPIVYCSPSFCRLTGYSEAEVIGRNCRFLQSPDGKVQKGEQRRFTSPEAVAHLKKNLLADKECQTSIINYRKGGSAFINLVTVIPISGGVSGLPHEETDVAYHVGFQVDLTEQPNHILQKLRDGSYIVNYSTQTGFSSSNDSLLGGSALGASCGAKKAQIAQPLISKELKKLLAYTDFVRSIPISSSTTVPPLTTSSADKGDSTDSNQWLSLMLLETCPDFVHVVSLKGSFLYVAPSVRRVLGYEPEEMVGGSIADFSHPEDIVPLMRELKESSSTGGASSGVSSLSQDGQQSAQISIPPRAVDLLFRARTKVGAYVWVECRGRLHVEPGKGRKAIILSGRAREMPGLKWDVVHRTGGLARSTESSKDKRQEQEFWSMLAGQGTFVVVASAVKAVLGWGSADLVGRYIGSLLSCDDTSGLEDEVKRMRWEGGCQGPVNNEREPQEKRDFRDFVRLRCRLRRAHGGSVNAMVVLYRPMRDALVDASPMPAQSISPSPIICQIKLDDSLHIGSGDGISGSFSPSNPSLALGAPVPAPLSTPVRRPGSNVFDELDTSRSSSWQYELQQLKFANQRLEDEVCFWEARLAQRQPREPAAVVDGQAQDNESEQLQHQVQQSLYVSPTQPVQRESVLVYPTDQQSQTQVHSPTAANVSCCRISPQTFALLPEAQAPLSPQHPNGLAQPHQTHTTPMQASSSPVYTVHTAAQDLDLHERSADHHNLDQHRYSHCHQTFHSHYPPLSYPMQQQYHHHRRQQSYPPSTSLQTPSSYSSHLHSRPQTRLKRSWDSAQYS